MKYQSVRAWLCRKVHMHWWKFAGIDMIPTGAYEECRVCGKGRYRSWV